MVKEGHEKLSTTSLKFLEYVKETPGCCNRSRFREIQWEDPLLPIILQPWPFFISQEVKSVFKESSTKIFALIRSIPRRLFANNTIKMSRYFDLPVEMLEQSLYGVDDEHIGNLIGRGDFVFSPSGLKCLEFNIASNFGGWEISLWQPMYLQNSIISGFIKKNRLKITNKNLIYIYFGHFIDAALKAFSRAIKEDSTYGPQNAFDVLNNEGDQIKFATSSKRCMNALAAHFPIKNAKSFKGNTPSIF